ncbi:MAG: putative glycoside hydrolase, partial [Acidimicrobiia bacterium]|nr:putative glycoside hydrolase [Acidimicrobiia bacterium]
ADARSYSLDLATDACRMGVDEVQFDYVRFPDGFGSRVQFDGPSDAGGRADAITSFLTEARAALSTGGCATAAAIFGFITSTPGEGGIGQQLEQLAGVVDVLSPMVYPSHYSTGWYGFADPNAHPYDVVSGALLDGERRLTGSPVVVRPWIQSFYYNGSQIQAESNAADDRGAGWMLWNSASNYATGSIVDESSLEVAQHSSSATFRLFPLSGFYRTPRPLPFAPTRVWME